MNNFEDNYIVNLENEIKELNILIEFCKENNYSKSIIFSLTSLMIKKRDRFLKLVK